MKITKRQLTRIIEEEKQRILKEQGMPGIEGPVRDLWGSRDNDDEFDAKMSKIEQELDNPGMAINYKLEELEEAILSVRMPEVWAEKNSRSLSGFMKTVDQLIRVLDKMR